MAFKVIAGGVAGFAAGACTMPFLGPIATIPVVASLTTAGAGIGWQISTSQNMENIQKTVDEKSKEAVESIKETMKKIADVLLNKFGEGAYNLMIQTGKKINILTAVFLVGTFDIMGMGIIYSLNNYNVGEFCINPQTLACNNIQFQSNLLILTISASICISIVKSCSFLWKEIEKNERKIELLNPEPFQTPFTKKINELKGRIERNEYFNPYDHLSTKLARELCYYLWNIYHRQIPFYRKLDTNYGQHAFQYEKYGVPTEYKMGALSMLENTYKSIDRI